jgi:hypothetical protein
MTQGGIIAWTCAQSISAVAWFVYVDDVGAITIRCVVIYFVAKEQLSNFVIYLRRSLFFRRSQITCKATNRPDPELVVVADADKRVYQGILRRAFRVGSPSQKVPQKKLSRQTEYTEVTFPV